MTSAAVEFPDLNEAHDADTTHRTPVSTDLLDLSLRDRLDRGAAGDLDAIGEAKQFYDALMHAIALGATPPQTWTAPPVANPSDVVIELDAAGALYVSAPGETETEVTVFEEADGQSGFDLFQPAQAPQRTIATTQFAKPVGPKRGRARKNGPANAGLPIDVPSLFASAKPAVGLHHPETSHQAVQGTSQQWYTDIHEQMFWMVVDRGEQGMCVFEATAILEQHEKGVHHGSVSGRMNWLMDNGYVEDSGQRRKTPKNRPAIAWVPTPWAKERIRLGYETHPRDRYRDSF